jgi:hypothetical protein
VEICNRSFALESPRLEANVESCCDKNCTNHRGHISDVGSPDALEQSVIGGEECRRSITQQQNEPLQETALVGRFGFPMGETPEKEAKKLIGGANIHLSNQ